jgi:cell division protein FtsB
MTEADLRELQQTAQKLEAAARKLSTGSGRDELLEDIAKFRGQIAALQQAAQGK